jgi:hypothetical protein
MSWKRLAAAVGCTCVAAALLEGTVGPSLQARQQSEFASAGELSRAVVRISAGQPGTGVIIARHGDAATVLTAAHVIQGAKQFRVAFAASPITPAVLVSADDVTHIQADDVNGLALFVIDRGVPQAAVAAPLDDGPLPPSVTFMGYPNHADTLRTLKKDVTGRSGSLIVLSGHVSEGASGGPIVSSTALLGMVVSTDASATYAVIGSAIKVVLDGWGITATAGSSRVQRAKSIADFIATAASRGLRVSAASPADVLGGRTTLRGSVLGHPLASPSMLSLGGGETLDLFAERPTYGLAIKYEAEFYPPLIRVYLSDPDTKRDSIADFSPSEFTPDTSVFAIVTAIPISRLRVQVQGQGIFRWHALHVASR